MSNSTTKGRYDAPEYIEVIKQRFEDKFPDNVPKDFVIDHCIKYFWKYIEDTLKADGEVKIFSYGKFYIKGMVSPRSGKFQYYAKFKFSRHFNLRLREFKGTATESELNEIKKKKEFMKEVWEKRKEHTRKARGKLHPSLENYGV